MDRVIGALLRSIQQDMMDIIANANHNDTAGVKALAAGVATKIAGYRAEVAMAEEFTDSNRYSLANLPKPSALDTEDDPESTDFQG